MITRTVRSRTRGEGLLVDDPAVSQRHLEIRPDQEDGLLVHDLAQLFGDQHRFPPRKHNEIVEDRLPRPPWSEATSLSATEDFLEQKTGTCSRRPRGERQSDHIGWILQDRVIDPEPRENHR